MVGIVDDLIGDFWLSSVIIIAGCSIGCRDLWLAINQGYNPDFDGIVSLGFCRDAIYRVNRVFYAKKKLAG